MRLGSAAAKPSHALVHFFSLSIQFQLLSGSLSAMLGFSGLTLDLSWFRAYFKQRTSSLYLSPII
jgi:hypothetical protein